MTQKTAAKPLSELKFDLAKLDTEKVDCNSKIDVIDECGLQQGFSHRFADFSYPTNHTFLLSSCKRQTDALKCLRSHAKCLPSLSKQVLLAMVKSREKYNKKICTEKQSEQATKLLELSQCMETHKSTHEKGNQAELNSITVPEAIVNTKIDSIQDRIKVSCCSVSKVRKDYLDASVPNCKQYQGVASDIIDSYLADTVGIICPNFDSKDTEGCDKLNIKITPSKKTNAKSFIRPIIDVIGTLTPNQRNWFITALRTINLY